MRFLGRCATIPVSFVTGKVSRSRYSPIEGGASNKGRIAKVAIGKV